MCWLSNSSLYSPPVPWQCQHQPPSFSLRAGLLHTSPSSPCQLEGMPHQCAPRSGASWRWIHLKWAVARLQLRAPPSLQRDLAVLHLAGSLVAHDLNRMHWTVIMFCSIVTKNVPISVKPPVLAKRMGRWSWGFDPCMENHLSPTWGTYVGLDIDRCMKFAGWIGKGNGCCFFVGLVE